jgi:hypothetical protein
VKKLVVGCLVVLVLAVILGGVASYFLYRAASPMFQNARNYLEGMADISELDNQIANKSAFTAPANGELTEDQVTRFVRVQDGIRAALGRRFEEIEAKYKHLKGTGETPAQPSLSDLISAVSDLGNLFVQAKRNQVEALNREGFAPAEYSWVRDRVFQAAGIEATSKIDFRKLEDMVRDGTGITDLEVPRVPMLQVPDRNRALVKPHLDKVDQWLPLMFFGL